MEPGNIDPPTGGRQAARPSAEHTGMLGSATSAPQTARSAWTKAPSPKAELPATSDFHHLASLPLQATGETIAAVCPESRSDSCTWQTQTVLPWRSNREICCCPHLDRRGSADSLFFGVHVTTPSSRERDEHRCKTVVGNDNRHRNHTGSACPFRDGRAAQSSDANSSTRGTARNGNSANRHAPGTYGDGDHHHGSARDRVSSPSHAAGLRPPRLETLDRRRPGLPRCPQRGTDCRKPDRSCLSNQQEVQGDDQRMVGPVQQCHRQSIQADSTLTTWYRWATRTTVVPGTGRPIGESNTPTTWTTLST